MHLKYLEFGKLVKSPTKQKIFNGLSTFHCGRHFVIREWRINFFFFSVFLFFSNKRSYALLGRGVWDGENYILRTRSFTIVMHIHFFFFLLEIEFFFAGFLFFFLSMLAARNSNVKIVQLIWKNFN